MQIEHQYIDLYNKEQQTICSNSVQIMNTVREKAFNNFKKHGFPTIKCEEYRYTDISKLFEPNYGLNLQRIESNIQPYNSFKCDVPHLSTSLFFVVNDQFYKDENINIKLQKGMVVDSISSAIDNNYYRKLIEKYYSKIADTDKDAITAFNTAFAQDGLFIYIPKGMKVEKTIQIVNILHSKVDLMLNRRVLIIVDEGAEVSMLFCDDSADKRRFLATQIIEAYVSDNAKLELNCLEETHLQNVRLSNVYIEQQKNSRVNHNVITLYNGITRNHLNLVFRGEGSECFCNGCVIADKKQHIDNNTRIIHAVGHCKSNLLYKYVLDDYAVGAFSGLVYVNENAQKTLSEEVNQNICASSTARMFTQPMLEIYADDVQCNHGSTVGQLNDAAMFYMQQRGINKKEAKLLLEFAFVNEVIDKMELIPLKERLHNLVEKRFRGELEKCENCRLCH